MIENDFTIIIQGPIHRNTLTMSLLHPNINTIISTWDDPKWTHPRVEEYLEKVQRSNLKIIVNDIPDKNKMEKVYNYQNRYYQFFSTLAGLKQTTTPFVIKMRSDEYYENIMPMVRVLQENDEKLVTGDVFFRKVKYLRYHISDHLMAARTSKMMLMFEELLYDCEFNIDKLKFAPFNQHDFWLFVEQQIGMKFIEICERKEGIEYKHPSDYDQVKNIMIKHFDIVNSELLGEFNITANSQKRVYSDLSYYDETRDIFHSLEEL